jgi:hypothetical protein
MALGVKREWKKRYDGSKDYPGHPETPHMHETHIVIQNRRRIRDVDILGTLNRTFIGSKPWQLRSVVELTCPAESVNWLDQMTQKERWAWSPRDGQQMTLTISGTLEAG